MKKIIILSMLMLLGVGVRAADYGYLVFTLSDGTTKSITSTGVNITFADGKLTATGRHRDRRCRTGIAHQDGILERRHHGHQFGELRFRSSRRYRDL